MSGDVVATPALAAARVTQAYIAALQFTLTQEGVDLARGDTGWVNNPHDPGGETRFGITAAEYSAWCASHGQPPRSMRELTYAEAAALYRERYWLDVRADFYADVRPTLALCTFDWAVNGGTSRGRRYLQAALGVAIDGAIGPVTIAAARSCDERIVIARYLGLRSVHYHLRAAVPAAAGPWRDLLVAAGLGGIAPQPNPTQREFLKGWLARCRAIARAAGIWIGPSYDEGAERLTAPPASLALWLIPTATPTASTR